MTDYELDRKMVVKDLLEWAEHLKKADEEIRAAYAKMNQVYKEVRHE